MMRLQKFLSRAEVASRRRAEEMIRAGRVKVNGAVVREMGVRVDPDGDRVEVDGAVVRIGAPVWIALNKPRGYVTTRSDPRGRPTVYDLLPPERRGLFHVGRLDQWSEGLLLLTNEGETANRLLHPRYELDRVYDVLVIGDITDESLERLEAGVPLEDGMARAQRIRRLACDRPERSRVRVVMREGRKREVRRMFESVGHRVRRLRRRSYGPIRLGDLPAGSWRELAAAEVAALRRGGTAGGRGGGARGRN